MLINRDEHKDFWLLRVAQFFVSMLRLESTVPLSDDDIIVKRMFLSFLIGIADCI